MVGSHSVDSPVTPAPVDLRHSGHRRYHFARFCKKLRLGGWTAGCWQLSSRVCKVSWAGRKPSTELCTTRINTLNCLKLCNAASPRDPTRPMEGRLKSPVHPGHTLLWASACLSPPRRQARFLFSAPQTNIQLSD